MRCYVGVEPLPEPRREKVCELERGFRTCYTKYIGQPRPSQPLLYRFSQQAGRRRPGAAPAGRSSGPSGASRTRRWTTRPSSSATAASTSATTHRYRAPQTIFHCCIVSVCRQAAPATTCCSVSCSTGCPHIYCDIVKTKKLGQTENILNVLSQFDT